MMIQRILLSVALMFLVACSEDQSTATTANQPQVMLGDSLVTGVRESNGVEAFLGLPFAEPPVAELRWQKPIPWQASGEAVDATRFAPACMQNGSGLAWYHGMMGRVGVDPELMEGPEYSEDCLYLNVWSDMDDAEAKPVLIFIHGGSNTGGWSYEPNYHGEVLAKQGVVVVTVAYRLGVFGWLSHPDLDVQNVGLHDLGVALDWVVENIGAFGGDPSRITVSGESAGAANAMHLALSPLSRGNVQTVIHQSAGWAMRYRPNSDEAFKRGQALAEKHTGSPSDIEALRQTPAEDLMSSMADVYQGYYFSPIVDDASLPESLYDVARAGSLPSINLVIGSNDNESLMYIRDTTTLQSFMDSTFDSSAHAKVLEAVDGESRELDKIDRISTAVTYTCPSLLLADAIDEAGGRSWVYRFNRVREGFEPIGAYHGAELPYVFDQHDDWLPTDDIDQQLTSDLVAHWLSFVKTEMPAPNTAVTWPAWNDNRGTLLFGDTVESADHPDIKFCQLLQESLVSSS